MKKIMIEVGGKAYPCHLTMGAMLLFKQNTGKDLADGLQSGNLEDMLMFLWCCIASTCRGDHVEFGVTFEEFCDLVTPESMAQWNKTIAEANEQQKKTEP